MHWNSKGIGSNGREGMDWSMRVRASRPREWASILYALYIGCQQVWPKLKLDFSTSEGPDSKWVFPLQMIWKKKKNTYIGILSHLGFLLIPDIVKLTIKNSHYNLGLRAVKSLVLVPKTVLGMGFIFQWTLNQKRRWLATLINSVLLLP